MASNKSIPGFRRNDYIAGIRAEYEDSNIQKVIYEKAVSDLDDLIATAKENHMWRFSRTLKKERRVYERDVKYFKKRRNELEKVLYFAEKYTPGKGEPL